MRNAKQSKLEMIFSVLYPNQGKPETRNPRHETRNNIKYRMF